ncbi:MAG: exo-alpha-sialidase [Gemmatimonadaceae bacterium]
MNLKRATLGFLSLLAAPGYGRRDATAIAQNVARTSADCSLVFSGVTTPLTDSAGARFFIDQPIVAEVRGGEAWLGDQVREWPGRSGTSTWLAGARKSSTGAMARIDTPDTTVQMQFPSLLAATNMLAHVVWGVRSDTSWMNISDYVRSISYGIYDGNKWSIPELVMKAPAIHWTTSNTSVLVADARMYVAAANHSRNGAPNQALVARRESGVWKQVVVAESRLPFGIQALRLQRAEHDAVVLVYSGFGRVADSSFAATFVSRSLDGGATWTAPKVLRALPPPAMPMLGGFHRLSDGTLHLIWASEIAGGGATEVLHEMSRDGGITWESAKPITAINKFDYLLSTQLGDRIVVTVRDSDRLLAQALVGSTIGFQVASSVQAPGLPVNIVRSGNAFETVWGLITGLTTADKTTIGVSAVLHSVTAKIKCRQ